MTTGRTARRVDRRVRTAWPLAAATAGGRTYQVRYGDLDAIASRTRRHGPRLVVPGRTRDALRLGTNTGLFHFTGSGGSPMRINDDPHRYGGIRDLAGDPRIDGRVSLGTGCLGLIAADHSARVS